MTEEEKKWDKRFEEWWNQNFGAPPEVMESFGYLQQKLFAKEGYLEACRKRQEEIERLKEGLKDAIHELECSGLSFDHPTLVRLRRAENERD